MLTLRANDIISPRKVRDDPNRPTSIDIYRSNRPTDVKVPGIVVMIQSDKRVLSPVSKLSQNLVCFDR